MSGKNNRHILFQDELLSEKFEKDGYVIVPFLSTEEVQQLKELYERYKPSYQLRKIYSNLEDNTKETNLLIEQSINDIFQPHIFSYFSNYKYYGGSFLVKGIGPNSICDLHQDWNAVDEQKNISFSIWVPLEDTNEENGCLKVVPGSHNWFNTIRSVNISSLYISLDERVKNAIKTVPVKAGTAVIFSQNLFHGSLPNTTDHVRVAVHTVLVNKDAELIHYIRLKEENKILKVECSSDFLYDHIFNISKGVMPQTLNVLDEMEDDGRFSIDEKSFRQKIEAEV